MEADLLTPSDYISDHIPSGELERPREDQAAAPGPGEHEEVLGAGGQTHPQIQSWSFRQLKYFVFSSS